MSSLLQKLPLPQALVARLEPLLALVPSSVPRPLKWAFFALLIRAWAFLLALWAPRRYYDGAWGTAWGEDGEERAGEGRELMGGAALSQTSPGGYAGPDAVRNRP